MIKNKQDLIDDTDRIIQILNGGRTFNENEDVEGYSFNPKDYGTKDYIISCELSVRNYLDLIGILYDLQDGIKDLKPSDNDDWCSVNIGQRSDYYAQMFHHSEDQRNPEMREYYRWVKEEEKEDAK